jgi:ABC-type glycerol-3-phosphate transport system substrate-binding protein
MTKRIIAAILLTLGLAAGSAAAASSAHTAAVAHAPSSWYHA